MLHADHAQQIADAFGLGANAELDGPVARGEVGQVWKLMTDAGTFAVKEPFDSTSFAGAEDEANFQEAAIAGGVPAPRVLRTISGAVVAVIDHSPLRLYEWIELRPPDRNLEPEAVGAAVARLHRVAYHGTNGEDPWYIDPVGDVEWDAVGAALRAAGAPFAERFCEQRTELVALEGLLEEPARLQTCHRDLFADNVLATDDGELCIIDWENSGLADPSQELAVVLFEFAASDPLRIGALVDAYREHGGLGVVDRPQCFSMAIAQLGHIGELSALRWLADPEPAHRARNEARVNEFLDDGITRVLIEQMLDILMR
jgi:Ser/Thr protein kinase RdoA (MazF antagonist)